MFGDLGYYTMDNPDVQLDTLETPFPMSFPGEWSEPVPGWGMNPLLAGPRIIAVGAEPGAVPGAQQWWTLAGVVIVGAFIFYALKRDKTARARRYRRRA